MNTGNKYFQNNIDFFILCLCSIAALFNLSAMPNVINSIAKEFSLEYKDTSKLIYYFMFPYGIGALSVVFIHRLINRYKSLLLSMSVLFILNLLISASNNFSIILLLRSIMGFFSCIVIPTNLTIIKDIYEKTKTEKIGYLFGINAISSITATLLTGFLAWQYFFLIPGLISGIALLLLIFIFHKQAVISLDQQHKSGILRNINNYLLIFRYKNKRSIFFLIYINSFICTGFYAYLGYYLNNVLHYSLKHTSYILTSSIIGSICINFIIGKLEVILGKKKNIRYGFFLLSLVFILFSLNKIFILFIPVIFFYGMSRALIHNTLVSSFLDFPRRLTNNASSLNSFIVFLSGASSVRIMYIFYNALGFINSILVISLGIFILNCIYMIDWKYFSLHDKNIKKKNNRFII